MCVVAAKPESSLYLRLRPERRAQAGGLEIHSYIKGKKIKFAALEPKKSTDILIEESV